MSKIFNLLFFLVKFKTFSIIISVSGLGIKVSFVTKNSEFQKTFFISQISNRLT